jgi:hypothetical protein
MDNKKLGIILVVLGISLLGIIIYFLFFFNFSEDIQVLTGTKGPGQVTELAQIPGESPAPQKTIKEITITKDEDAKPAGEAEVKATELKKIAMSFAERFGSYSNHSDFSNVVDLKLFMSESMQKWADNFVEVGRRSTKDMSTYQGVITKAVTSEVKAYNLGTGVAQILVGTQKVATDSDSDNTKTTYEDLLVTFVKENNEWKVNEAEWE